MAAPRTVDDVAEVDEIAFQNVQRAQPVQRLHRVIGVLDPAIAIVPVAAAVSMFGNAGGQRSEEHTSELQSLMRISYAVFCLQKTKIHIKQINQISQQHNYTQTIQTSTTDQKIL